MLKRILNLGALAVAGLLACRRYGRLVAALSAGEGLQGKMNLSQPADPV